MHPLTALILSVTLVATLPAGDAVSQWRGDGKGVLPAEASVTSSDAKGANVLWSADLPSRGFSSVVVAQGKVILTCEPDTVVALDAKTGAKAWERTCDAWLERLLGAKPEQKEELRKEMAEIYRSAAIFQGQCPEVNEREKRAKALLSRLKLRGSVPCQGDYSGASPTPAVVGDTVVVRFGAGILVGLAIADGAIRWELVDGNLGLLDSPIPCGGNVLLIERGKAGPTVSAFDAATGKRAFQTVFASKWDYFHQHASLTPMTIKDRTVVFAQNGAAVDAISGKLLAEGLFSSSYEVVPAGNRLVIQSYNGYKPENSSVSCFDLILDGDSLKLTEAWKLTGKAWSTSVTGVCDGTRVYLADGRAGMSVIDLASGKDVTQDQGKQRKPYKASGHAWTPPLTITGKHLVYTAAVGSIFFHELGPGLAGVGSIDLVPTVRQKEGNGHATIVDGKVFARDHFKAYCFGTE
jgi:outer membrane protein assembly factor BamB